VDTEEIAVTDVDSDEDGDEEKANDEVVPQETDPSTVSEIALLTQADRDEYENTCETWPWGSQPMEGCQSPPLHDTQNGSGDEDKNKANSRELQCVLIEESPEKHDATMESQIEGEGSNFISHREDLEDKISELTAKLSNARKLQTARISGDE